MNFKTNRMENTDGDPRLKFGLVQPTLIQQIKKILDQYPDDGQILKELIQNAEDAGAKNVKFLFDHRSYKIEKLKHPGLAKFQGPALYAYNDEKFKDDDWKGIGMLCDSIKAKDPTKVGRFGLGFKSVFHMTDLPSMISGEFLGIMDPHEEFFSNDFFRMSGRKMYLSNDQEDISDQFAPYKGVFDCTEESFRQGCYEGTLFRLPLRQEASVLSETVYSEEKIQSLFKCFEKDAHLILLFLINLELIEVYKRDGEHSEPRKLFHVGISPDCLQDVRQAREDFKAKVQNNRLSLSDGTFSEVKKTYSLTIEAVHYHDGGNPHDKSRYRFVVTLFFSGCDVTQEIKELMKDESLSYLPLLGVALPLKPQLKRGERKKRRRKERKKKKKRRKHEDIHTNINRDDDSEDDNSSADSDQYEYEDMESSENDNERDASGFLENEPQGHLFCFLPLPLENKSLTGLPVHVNGFFALSQNRRHLKWPSADQDEGNLTDKSLLWNKGLLEEVLPKAYAELILYVTSYLSREESHVMMTTSDVYGAWPDITKVDVKWKDILKPLFKVLFKYEVLHSDANGGVWCKVEDVILDNLEKSDQSRKIVIDVLNKTGKMVVTAPVHVKTAVEQYCNVRYITPKVLRKSLKKNPSCYSDLSYEDKILLLKFVLEDSDFKDLHDLELLPLSDKTFTTFQRSKDLIYIDSAEHPKSLLSRLQKMFLDTKLDNTVIKQLENAVKKGQTQLSHFDKEAVKRHLRESLVPDWLGSEDHVTWYPGRSDQPTLEWMKELWLYFGKHFNHTDLDAFLGLPLIPVSLNNQSEVQLARIQRPSSLVLTSFSDENIDDSVCTILKTLGLTILSDLPEYLQHYSGLVPNIANPASPKGVLNAMGVFITKSRNEETQLQILRSLHPDEIRSFRTFLSRISSVTLDEEHLLRKLPLFKTFVGNGERKTRFVSIKEVSVGAPVDDLPDVSVFTDLLDLRDHGSRDLAQLLNTVPITNTELLKMLLDDALNNKYSCMEVDILVKHILERFGIFHGKDLTCIKEKLQRLPFVVCSDNSRKKPTELFNPEVDLLRQVFIDQDVFPEDSFYSRPEVNAHLKKLGLKGEEDITPSDIVNCASLVNGIPDIDKASKKSKGILKYLNVHMHLIKKRQASGESFHHKLSSFAWIPVVHKKPLTYSTRLHLKKSDNGSAFAHMNDVTSNTFINIVGSVKYLVDIQESYCSQIFNFFNWNGKPSVNEVVMHLGNVISSYDVGDKSFFIIVVKDIYQFLAYESCSVVRVALQAANISTWVWNGDGFSRPNEISINNPSINLSPYFSSLPPETKEFSDFFKKCGIKDDLKEEELLNILWRIKETHDKENQNHCLNEVQRDLTHAITILNKLKPQKGEVISNDLREKLLVPIQANEDKLHLVRVVDCSYCDLEWRKQGHYVSDFDDKEIKLIHQDIPDTTAELLGVPTLLSRFLGAEELDMGESFGQSESLLDRIHGLLEGYTDGLSVPKELIQNADDAGATEVKFLYDERTNEDCMTCLIDEGMKECQGPALWAYNDAVFSEEDFQNIVKLNAATKKEDSRKIGRFGLGFNSVYNLTDVPSFVSRNFIVILDPHTTYLGKGIRDKSKPGIKLRIEEKKLRRLANQFKPYNGIFGCDLRPEGQPKTYNGTLFRFPLRTASQAQKSGIKKLHYDDEQVKELLRILFKGAESLLLFTQNVLRVSVYHLRNERTESPQPIELFYISKSCHQFIDQLESEVSLSKPAQELASKEQEFVRQSSILKASSGLMQGRMNENIKSPTRVLMKSAMILNCQCTISDHGKQYFALGSELSVTHQILWLVTSCMVSGRAFEMAVRNKGLLPTAGVAAKLIEEHSGTFVPVPITMSAKHEVSHQGYDVFHNGSVFCFLPLPIHSGLPIHINGCFAVDDNRRHLRERAEEDKKDQGAEWNEVLMREVVCPAYITLLEEMKRLSLNNGYKFHSLWPRSRDVQTNCRGIAAEFYRSLLRGLAGTFDSLRMPKLFTDGHTWSDIQNVVFLEPAFRSNEKIGQVALDVFKASLEGTKTIVVDLPEEILESFERYELRNEVQKKCYNKERFFREVFFPVIGSTDMILRNKLVLFAIDDTSEELRQLVSNHPCIPSSPLGHQLKYPKDLIHPNGKAAQLFSSEDGRFPYGEDFANEERLVKLKKLGMREDDLEWHEVIERAESIKNLAPYQKGLTRTKLILDFVDRKLDNNEELDKAIQTRLQQIQFLPLLKKPKDFPFKWKGDEYAPDTFLSAKKLYSNELKYLASVSVPILDETKDGCGLLHQKVKNVLAMRERASLDQVKTQLKSVIMTAETCNYGKFQLSLRKAFEKLYDYLQCNLEERKDEIVDFLAPLTFILGQNQLLSTNQVAFSSAIDYSPYLCKVPDNYRFKYYELFKTVGIRESFELHDYLKTLQDVKFKYGENPVTEDQELNHVVRVLKLTADFMEKEGVTAKAIEKDGSIFIIDSNRVMKPSNKVCVKDCYWMPDEPGVGYVNEDIPPHICITLGANTRRQETLRKHTIGIPFGQKEKLTNRLKRILTGYPCDESIMKELLQNADDAKASKICFIKDPRQHPSKKVFEDCWKPLQGPALCVYNNAPFTKSDIEGIQNLGEGNKGDDPNKTGQYGVGFNAVYHLTDAPTFISQGDEIGEVMCVFDPLLKFAPGADTSNPGVMYKDLPRLRQTFTDVFPCYYLDQHLPLNNATMFRFPLRNEDMARKSTISNKAMTIEELDKLLNDFEEELLETLLFVNNVKKISICEINKKTRKLKETYHVQASLSSEEEKKRTEFAAHVNKIAKSVQSGKRSIIDIPVSEVSYVLHLKDSRGLNQKWFVVQRIGFENKEEVPLNVDEAFKKGDLGLLPRGGVASLISSSKNNESPAGKAFCFLPLPFKTGLPVHINGHFALDHEARRSLWRDDKGDYRSKWNDTLLRQVVAPCYVALLDEVRQHLSLQRDADGKTCVSGNREMGESFLLYYLKFFPSFNVEEKYWRILCKEVYCCINAKNFRLLPVLRQENQGKKSSTEMTTIEWLPPTGKGCNHAFFDNLEDFFRDDTEELQDKRKSTVLQKKELLRDTLLGVGFNLLFMPMTFYNCFRTSGVNVSLVSPKDVNDFFQTYDSSEKLCDVGSLPSRIECTKFKNINSLLAVLKYCKQDEDFLYRLEGLPLLLTEDTSLRVFNQSHKVFLSRYNDLLPSCSSMFVHRKVFNSVFQSDDELNEVFKVFDIAAFARFLHKEMKKSYYKTTNRYIEWHPEVKDNQIPNSQWIWHVWRFFSNNIEKIVRKYDEDQREKRPPSYSLLPYDKRRKVEKQNEKQDIMEKKRVTKRELDPLKDWCLLPAFEAVPQSTSKDVVKHFLVPISMADTLIYLEGSGSETLKTVLRKVPLSELNCRLPNGVCEAPFYETARRIVADLDDPKSVLSALTQKLNIDSRAFKRLREIDCINLLEYFNDTLLQLDHASAEEMKKLPLYSSINDDIISISEKQAFVLSRKIPKDDMHLWKETSGIVFLKESNILRMLYEFLGCHSKDEVDVYCDVIFEHFEDMKEKARLKHMKFARKLMRELESSPDYSSDKVITENKAAKLTKLSETLSKLKFIQAKDGTLMTASSFYDPSNKVFKVMFENKQEMFPSAPFCDSEWTLFLRKIGLIHQVSNDKFFQFAKEIETEAKTRHDDETRRKSETLITCLFESEDVASSNLLDEVKGMCFIFPYTVRPRLQSLYEQYGSRETDLPCICFQGSVVSRNPSITWTSANLLPDYANPLLCKTVDITSEEKDKMFRKLDILQNPRMDMVVTHCKNICNRLSQITCSESDDKTVLIGVMTSIYKYLQNNYNGYKDVINELQKICCIVVNDGRRFVYPNQVAVDITSDREIQPYLYKIPLELATFASFFEKLGTSKTVTFAQYAMVLENIHRKSGNESLDPNETSKAFKATKGIFEVIVKENFSQDSEISQLFLPGVKLDPKNFGKKLVFLRKSTDIFYNDAPHFKERIKKFNNLVLVKLSECDLNVTNDEVLVKKLPERFRPCMLTTCVHETLIERSQPVSCSSTAQELRQILTSSEFCHGLIRLIRHADYKSDAETRLHIPTFQERLSCIHVYSVQQLRTRLVCKGETIPESEADVSCFEEKAKDEEKEIWNIYIEKAADLIKYVSMVAEVVDRITGHLLKTMLVHLPMMLSSKPCEIKDLLDGLKIREDNSFPETEATCLPTPGNFIHIADHHLLVDDFTVFYPGEYVGYELDDPSLRGEDGTPTYIYAIIIEEVTNKGRSSTRTGNLSTKRYRIDIGKENEPIVVDAADLYKFYRPNRTSNETLQLEIYSGHQTRNENQDIKPDNLDEARREVTRILKDAWRLPEEKQKKIIKRLYLKWHPDKNPGNEKFCTEVFKFIQKEIKRLEDGPNIKAQQSKSAGNKYHEHSFSSFFKTWGKRATSHKKERNSFNDEGFSFSQRKNPQPAEAKRWFKQATADLNAAMNEREHKPSYEWVCFKCHQSSEKVLKAAQYSIDADKNFTHSLTMIAQYLGDSTLQGLASKLENVVGNSVRMRYPDQMRYPDIPNSVYTKAMASRAIVLASDIIKEVKLKFMD